MPREVTAEGEVWLGNDGGGFIFIGRLHWGVGGSIPWFCSVLFCSGIPLVSQRAQLETTGR